MFKRSTFKSGDQEYMIQEGLPEYNQMAYYNVRMDRRSDDRDLSLTEGNVVKFYRSTMSLLMNCIPRFKSKGMLEELSPDSKPDDDTSKKLIDDLQAIGNKLKSLKNIQNEKYIELNSLQYEEELFKYNIRLNNLMFKYGMIFPEKENKSLKDKIGEDF